MKKKPKKDPISQSSNWSKEDKTRHKKQAQIFNELLENPRFQRSVRRIRKRYGIPEEGFKDWKKYSEWEKQIRNRRVTKTVKRERIRLDIRDNPKATRETFKIQINPYFLSICKILQQHDLALDWGAYIEAYVSRSKNEFKPHTYDAVLLRETYKGTRITEEIYFTISASLGIPALTNRWRGRTMWADQVEPLQRLMQGYAEKKRRTVRRANEQKKAFKMFKRGKKDEEIWEEIYSADRKEDPEVELQTIRQWRKRYKKRTGND